LPTPEKAEQIEMLADRMKRMKIAISTDFSGLLGTEMTEIRRRLREQKLEYRVVKNRLAAIAAERVGVADFSKILVTNSGLIFGYDDPTIAAKFMDDYVKQTRSNIKVRGAVMDGRFVSPEQLTAIAALPPRDVLLSRLFGQMKAPHSRLVSVLNATIGGLAIVLQRRAEQLQQAG